MIRLTKLADYGVILLTEMAENPAHRFTPNELAERVAIPKPTVTKLLKQMTQGGLLVSHRGKTGGYRLKGHPRQVSIAQVLAVLEGPFAITTCSEGVGICEFEKVCKTRRSWQRINQVIYESLDNLSLASMVEPRKSNKMSDTYTIKPL